MRYIYAAAITVVYHQFSPLFERTIYTVRPYADSHHT